MTNKLDRSLLSQMHDVAVRTDANESGEQPGKMERAAPRYLRAWRLDGFIDVSNHVISKPREHVFAQHASRPAFEL